MQKYLDEAAIFALYLGDSVQVPKLFPCPILLRNIPPVWSQEVKQPKKINQRLSYVNGIKILLEAAKDNSVAVSSNTINITNYILMQQKK